ncbi:LysR family transcriptional regulator [Castellaniella caeni]|uniref:LysR family transcriptional regulator n=1 Tax=Castellaniella caeni TaxID=266123 RepID=UPI0008341AC4|nr:LysR family transcriptional regulator [Castellaniella caeni]
MRQGFRHIRAFLQAARLGSFTQAAQSLHVSQPALTVQIRQLEEELGVRLFDRDRRQVSLSQEGRNMLAPLQRILDEFEGAIEQAHDLAGLKRGRLTVAALPSIAAAWLPALIHRFHAAHPGIDIHVADVPAARLQRLVKDEEADLGIGPWVNRDRALQFRELMEDSLQVFFPAEHPLAGLRRPTLPRLTRYPHVLTSPGTSVREAVHRALEAGNLDIEVACEVAYLSTAIGMVRAGLGIAILPLSTLHAAPCDGLLHRPIANPHLHRKLGLITAKRRTPSAAAQAFIELLLTQDLRLSAPSD